VPVAQVSKYASVFDELLLRLRILPLQKSPKKLCKLEIVINSLKLQNLQSFCIKEDTGFYEQSLWYLICGT